jgi:hypothetical protein
VEISNFIVRWDSRKIAGFCDAQTSVHASVAQFFSTRSRQARHENSASDHTMWQWHDYASGGHFPFYEMSTEDVEDVRKFNRLVYKPNL